MGKKTVFDLAAAKSLLGKDVTDPAVQEVLARLGKVKIKPDYVLASEVDVEYSVRPIEGKKKSKVLTRLFLGDKWTELPEGFERGLARGELLKRLPAPTVTWKIGPGEVPVNTKGVAHDTWEIDGYQVTADYRDEKVHSINLSMLESAAGGSLSTHPLHFETKPADAVPDAELTGMALLVAWAIEKAGLPPKHDNELGKQFAKRKMTPRRFLIEACGRTLTTFDVPASLARFLTVYTDNQHHDDEGGRDKTSAKIAKLLNLEKGDRCSYSADYLGTFKEVCENPFHIPDSWEAVDRIAPIIDARQADYAATKFLTSPDVKLFEKAAKARDAVKVTPERKTLAKVTVDDALAETLIGLLGRPLADKQVKEVLTRAGLPIGKRIDEQANPALGISYMGAKSKIEGKHQLGIDDVSFYANKYKTYIRGIGAEVEFIGFTGVLPKGVRIGDTREAVAQKLGKPDDTHDDRDYWKPSATRKIYCEFKRGKLAKISYFIPPDY